MILTPNELEQYFRRGKKSPIYEETTEMYGKLLIHADGKYPEKLINKRRPHESEYVHAYRKEIYKCITSETVGRVIQSIGGIRRSTDWNISYNEEDIATVRDGETLKDYCEVNFPTYSSVTNWVFQVLLKNYLVDANAVILIKPKELPEADNQYVKPYPYIFNSDQVLEYIEGEYAILLAREKYKVGRFEGQIWYVVDTETITKYAEVNSKRDIQVVDTYVHGLGYLPCVRVRAEYCKSVDYYTVYESRIHRMLPRLDEAVREYSDQQANIVNHLFPERWEMATQNCSKCVNDSGISTGKVKVDVGKGATKKTRTVDCSACGGTGITSTSGPYKKFVVRPANVSMGEQPTPTPPFGYVNKPVDIIETVDKRIDNHLYRALSAINMQFLDQTPLSQSGDAKEVDREELNKFIYNIAEDLVQMMDSIYKIICDYRYMVSVTDANKRKAMLPSIAVPEKYDLLSANYVADEVVKARNGKLNGVIVAALELEYCSKKFYADPTVKAELQCVMELDPLVGMSPEDKMVYYNNGAITREDYILSANIVPYVKRAMQEDKAFMSKSYTDRLTVVKGYAAAVIAAQKAEVMPGEPDSNDNPQNGQ